MRIGIATCKHPPVHDEDIDFLLPALRRRGAEVEAKAWNDPKVDWAGYDAVFISSTWDYDESLDAFRKWAKRTGKATRLHNPAATVDWNIDKRYLRDLEAAGVATIPTVWTEPGEDEEIERAIAELGWNDVIVKPVVDLGARRLARVEPEMLGRILAAVDAPGMAQPFLGRLQTEGELSLVLIGGKLTHAVRKRPARGDFRVQPQYGGSVEVLEPAADAVALAEAALAAAPGEPLYARADMIRDDDGRLRLIELELIEPNLYLGHSPAAAEELARALLAAG